MSGYVGPGRGETLVEFLMCLDKAIAKALTDDVYTDQINPKT
jgi:hypothetical protein